MRNARQPAPAWLAYRHVLTLISLFALNLICVIYESSFVLLTIPFCGLAMTGLLSAIHEAAHNTYFFGKRANRILGEIGSSVLLMSFKKYKRDHMMHHYHLGEAKDTEEHVSLRSRADLLYYIFVNHHAVSHWSEILRSGPKDKTVATKSLLCLYIFLVIVLSGTFTSPILAFQIFWLPFCIYLVMDNLVSLPEHASLDAQGESGYTRSLHSIAPLDFILLYVGNHEAHHEEPTTCVVNCKRSPMRCSQSYYDFYRSAWTSLPAFQDAELKETS